MDLGNTIAIISAIVAIVGTTGGLIGVGLQGKKIERELFEAYDRLCKQLQAKITANDAEIACLKAELATLRTENESLRERIKTLETENAELKAQIETLQQKRARTRARKEPEHAGS